MAATAIVLVFGIFCINFATTSLVSIPTTCSNTNIYKPASVSLADLGGLWYVGGYTFSSSLVLRCESLTFQTGSSGTSGTLTFSGIPVNSLVSLAYSNVTASIQETSTKGVFKLQFNADYAGVLSYVKMYTYMTVLDYNSHFVAVFCGPFPPDMLGVYTRSATVSQDTIISWEAQAEANNNNMNLANSFQLGSQTSC